jgi:polysaccharide biosynthesis/export protein
MKKKDCCFLVFAVLLIFVTSCMAPKQVAYFQYNSADSIKVVPTGMYEARIKPKDVLSIMVVTSNPEATKNYNLITPQLSTASSSLANSIVTTQQPAVQSYLVDSDGCIDFPTLGRIHVAGLTRLEIEKMIMDQIKSAFNQEMPVITINIQNYSVSVLGEVARPGKFVVANERITLLDAIAQAGDLTLYGRRDNIRILREHADGSQEYLMANINDRNLIHSPAYYLEQNDVVYVEPNKVRKRTAGIGSGETLSVSILSALISVASLIVTILK